MESNNLLPENDKDLLLAKEIGELLSTRSGISEVSDSIIPVLSRFKENELNILKNFDQEAIDIWQKIASKTLHKKEAKITSIGNQSSKTWIWAMAATVLICAFVGIFWLNTPVQPVLIAESGSEIEVVTLEDGSEITLRPNSSLFALTVDEGSRSYKITGEGFFNVTSNKDRPFSVDAGLGTIRVLGTRFSVSTWGNLTNVFLEEGSVQLSTENTSVILKPGEKAFVNNNGLSNPEQATINTSTDWMNNVLTLNRTPLAEVIAEVEHHFDIEIDISQAKDQSELISGSISIEDLNDTLNDLGVILGGTFRTNSTDRFTFIPLN